MTKCTTPTASFPRCKGREITARFDGGEITSDGGVLLLRQLDREMGLGVVIVLHDINMAARYCDRLVVLHGGHLLAQGTPEEMMNGDTLEAIYGIPMHVMAHPSGEHRVAIAH